MWNSKSRPAGKASDLQPAPIALFVYNRPGHARRTVDSLRGNDLAGESDFFVFSDAAKNPGAAAAVQQVRQFIRTVGGFKSVTIVEREGNLGVAHSVISGVTQLLNERGCAIVVEDDLLTTPDFLTFMNQALERNESRPGIFSVSGFNFAAHVPDKYPYDAFSFYRSSSLGWGTWKDRWEKADWNVSDYTSFCANEDLQRRFNRGGDDLAGMLELQMAGRIDSWAIRWAYAHFKNEAVALLSLRPRVFHIGSDGSGTHSRWRSVRQLPLTSERKSEFHFPAEVEPERYFATELPKLLRPSLARKWVRSIDNKLGLRRRFFRS
jgi:hypothetical protein